MISNNIDISKFGDYSDEIKNILNPYKQDRTNLKKVYSIFIGFNWDSLEKINLRNRDGMEDYLKSHLSKHSAGLYRISETNKKLSKINNSIIFFFIPFKDVAQIKENFTKMIS